jgi:hypothetical protein
MRRKCAGYLTADYSQSSSELDGGFAKLNSLRTFLLGVFHRFWFDFPFDLGLLGCACGVDGCPAISCKGTERKMRGGKAVRAKSLLSRRTLHPKTVCTPKANPAPYGVETSRETFTKTVANDVFDDDRIFVGTTRPSGL